MKAHAWALILSVAATCAIAQTPAELESAAGVSAVAKDKPAETTMRRARSVKLDLRNLPQTAPLKFERPEYEEPEPNPVELPGGPHMAAPAVAPVTSAPAPAPISNFAGLDFATWGAGHPPDTNGDVGPAYFIQTINTSIGVYRKSDGFQVAAFTFNTFMSQGAFGNLCDTNNFGDPVVLYDSFEDRWVITDFAFQLNGGGNVVNPPGAFQCFAVSKTSDPVSGGWNFYSINVAGGLGDYPKFSIWTDGIYMSANVFGYPSGAAFQNSRVFAFNKAQMYAGNPTVQVINFNAPAGDFTLLPSNARLQTGTPPPGTPAYFVSTWQFTNALTVYKFHVDWTRIANSTFTGPSTPLAATSWPNAAVANAPSQGGNLLDVLQIRAMMQNQYTNIGGVESLWATHTVRRQDTTGFAASRWYQVNVTGGTVGANLPQATTWDPDGANVLHRFVPSLAIDRAGDLALGYTTSSSTTKPALMYAGRLASDPINTFSQTEQLLIQGTGTQTGNCGSSACTRWGDYSAMTLDPDGCTFWYTGEYYATDGLNHQTRIGSFTYPSCTPVGAGGTVSGTVTQSGNPLSGATVALGSRTTTTDGSGFYSFSTLPAGTYPIISASFPGCSTATVNSIGVSDGNTTTQNFALSGAAGSACLIDTTQADFQTGIGTNVDLNTSPDDVTLLNADNIDQQNGTLGNSGVGITVTTYGGQTFTPAVTGSLKRVDINLFCSGCTGTTPNLTLSIRNTSGGLPTGADLATATVTGFNSGSAVFYAATFSTPFMTLNAGTQYALVIRPTANPSPGTYALTRSGTSTTGADVYAGGTRVSGATSGTVWSIPLTGGVSTDAGFRIYLNNGFSASGDLISGVKDANPAAGYSAGWTTLSWTAGTPTNTAIKFQAAASNSLSGPFNFVGPDGTAATFFTTSGASLSQFSGNRYLEYRAYLSTTDNTMTPTLNDVTVCYSDLCIPPPTPTVTPQGATTFTYPGTVILTSSSASGNQWYVDTGSGATLIGGATNQSYIAAGSGNYTVVVTINSCASASSAGTNVVVNRATPTVSATGGTFTYNGTPQVAGGTATGGAGESLPVTLTYTGTGTTTYGPSSTAPTLVGTYSVVAHTDGDANNTAGDSAPAALTITQATPTVIATGGTFTYDGNPHAGSATATGGAGESLTVSLTYNGTGSTTYGPSATAPSLAGTYTVTAHTNGDANNTAGDSTPTALTINKFNPLMAAFGGTFTYNASPRAGSGQAIGGAGETLPVTLSYQGISGTTYGPSAAPPTNVGVYLVTAHTVGDANNNAEDSLPNALRINKATATVAVNAYCVPFDGSPHTASGSATGVISESLASGLNLTATTHTAAGEYLGDAWTFNGSPNYSDANGAVDDSIIDAAITAPASAGAGSTGNIASVANAGAGATYNWSITNGTITAGTGTASIAFTAVAVGTLTLNVTVTNSLSCSASKSTNVTVSSMADLALTLTDNHTNTMIGNSVNYIIEVTNPTGPSQMAATVTDTLPAGLGNGSWTCIAFGGAVCASGYGNALSDAVTLPVGSEAAYVYSATVISGNATDQLTNTASVTVPAGSIDPNMANNSATDTDVVHIFIDSFEGTPLMLPNGIGNGGDYVAATLHVDANLLNTLSLVPTAVAVGRGADGKMLFTLELARFGSDIVLRALTKDGSGASRQSAWQSVNLDQHLLTFAWQTASNSGSDGYLQIGTSPTSLLSASTERNRLTQLWVAVENSVPWLVLITN